MQPNRQPPRSPSGQSLGLIIEESLGAVFAPARRAVILQEALRTAELPAIPERPVALRVFVEGALFSTLIHHVEVSDALEIVGQIRAVLELAMSATPDERPHSEVREPVTLPAPPTRVLVVTSASLVVFLLSDMLGEHVDVVPIGNGADLQDRLRRFGAAPLLVVIDRKHPCAPPSIATLLARQLEPGSKVVWWSGDPVETAQVAAMLGDRIELVPCKADLRLADLGELCRHLTDAAT